MEEAITTKSDHKHAHINIKISHQMSLLLVLSHIVTDISCVIVQTDLSNI